MVKFLGCYSTVACTVLGLSAIDATTTPDSVVLLCESILPQQTPNLHRATPSRSVAISV